MQTKSDNKTFHKFFIPSTWICIYVIYTHSSPPSSWSASSNLPQYKAEKRKRKSPIWGCVWPQLTGRKRARPHHGLQKQNVKSRSPNQQGRRARVKQSHVLMTVSGFHYMCFTHKPVCTFLVCWICALRTMKMTAAVTIVHAIYACIWL